MMNLEKYVGMTNFKANLNLRDAATGKDGILTITKKTITDIKVKTNKKGETYVLIYENNKPVCGGTHYTLKNAKKYLNFYFVNFHQEAFLNEYCDEAGCKFEEAILKAPWLENTTEEIIREKLENIAIEGYKKEIKLIQKKRAEMLKELKKEEAKYTAKIC